MYLGGVGLHVTGFGSDPGWYAAGLRKDDIILSVDGRRLTTPQQFLAYLNSKPQTEPLQLGAVPVDSIEVPRNAQPGHDSARRLASRGQPRRARPHRRKSAPGPRLRLLQPLRHLLDGAGSAGFGRVRLVAWSPGTFFRRRPASRRCIPGIGAWLGHDADARCLGGAGIGLRGAVVVSASGGRLYACCCRWRLCWRWSPPAPRCRACAASASSTRAIPAPTIAS